MSCLTNPAFHTDSLRTPISEAESPADRVNKGQIHLLVARASRTQKLAKKDVGQRPDSKRSLMVAV